MNSITRKTLGASLALFLALAAGSAAVAQRGEARKNASPAQPVSPPGLSGGPPGASQIQPDGAVVVRQVPPNRRLASDEQRNRAILTLLDEHLTMSFPQETPFEDVLKYVKSNTQNQELGLPAGIPIYIDPASLLDSEKNFQSPVTLDLEGIPLRRTLHLVLHQLGLTYFVADGLLVITSADSDDPTLFNKGPTEPSPLAQMRRKAERGEMSDAERKEFLQMLQDLKQIHTAIREIEEAQLRHDPGTAESAAPRAGKPAPPGGLQ